MQQQHHSFFSRQPEQHSSSSPIADVIEQARHEFFVLTASHNQHAMDQLRLTFNDVVAQQQLPLSEARALIRRAPLFECFVEAGVEYFSLTKPPPFDIRRLMRAARLRYLLRTAVRRKGIGPAL